MAAANSQGWHGRRASSHKGYSIDAPISKVFLKEPFKYYFADFVRRWGTPLPFTDYSFGKKGVTDLGGTPNPPFMDFSPKVFLQKGLKILFFAQKKHLSLVQKIGYGFGGYPPPPFTDFFLGEKGVYGFGGYPPPLRTKSAK